MKKSELLFVSIQVPLDYAMLLIAAFFAYKVRFGEQVVGIRPAFYSITLLDFLGFAMVGALIWIAMFFLNGLYSLKATRNFQKEIVSVFVASSASVLVLVVMIFLNRYLFSSRFIIITSWIASIIFVLIGRFILLQIQRYMLRRGIGTHKLVVIGTGEMVDYIRQTCINNQNLGYVIVDVFDRVDDTVLQRLKLLSSQRYIDELIISDSITLSHADKERIYHFSMVHHVILKYIPDFSGMIGARLESDTSLGIPVIEIKKTSLDGWGRIVKRLFDVLCSSIGLVLLSPLFALIALLIKLDSPGPVIYKNERVGQKGKLFFTYKFRTMKIEYCVTSDNKNNAAALAYEQELIKEKSGRKGPLYKVLDDPRRTNLGKFLERTSLDEFTQLFNVWLGNMSLVGPRPHQAREVSLYQDYHLRLLDIKPGMTGLAQVSGRSDLDFEDEYRLDMYYIENWTFWLDIFILLKTIPVLLIRRHKTTL